MKFKNLTKPSLCNLNYIIFRNREKLIFREKLQYLVNLKSYSYQKQRKYHHKMSMNRHSQMGRGRGSFRVSQFKDSTPQKKAKSSFRNSKRNVNFDPKQFIVAECTVRDVEIYKQVFDFLDDDHDGMLTPLDLRKAIREYGGYKPGRAFVYVAMSVFDADDGGQISFKEFVKLMTQKPCENDTNEDIERIFEYIDQDNKGYISEEDLMQMAEQLHEEVSKAEIKDMINHCDPQGLGYITKESFIAFNKRKNFE